MKTIELFGRVSAASLALALPVGAWAQEATSAPAQGAASADAPEDTNALQDIVVTANRRAEASNKVGMSILALGGTALSEARISSVNDLTAVVPGFTSAATPAGAPVYSLRGLGFIATNIADTGTVGTYVDGVSYAYPFMSKGVSFDIERVEVLKGPQGTLFGRSTTAGLINRFEAYATAEIGNYETRNFEAMINIPLSNTVKIRIAGRSEDSDKGWQRSYSRPDDRLGAIHRFGARGELAWDPSENFSSLVTVNYWRDRSQAVAGQFVGILANSPGLANPALYPDGFLDYVSSFKATNAKVADWQPLSERQGATAYSVGLTNPLSNDEYFWGLSWLNTLHLNDNLSLVSTTSYNILSRNDGIDVAGVPFEEQSQDTRGEIRSFQEELRLEGQNGPVNWIIGGYYARDRISIDDTTLQGQNSQVVAVRLRTLPLLANPVLNPAGYTAAETLDSFRSTSNRADYRTEIKSIFAHAGWRVLDDLKLTVGTRYSDDDQRFEGCSSVTADGNRLPIVNVLSRAGLRAQGFNPSLAEPLGCATFNTATQDIGLVSVELREKSWSWLGGADWQVTPTTLLYVSVNHGYKAGVIPLIPATVSTAYTPAEKEEVTAYEAGFKAALFNRRAQFNASVFYNDYSNKQTTGRIADPLFGTLRRLVNVPKSRVVGVDADFSARLSPELSVRFSGTYVDTKIQEFSTLNVVGVNTNYAGAPLPYVPKVQLSGSLSYRKPVSDKLGFQFSLNARYQSKSHADLDGLREFDIKAYGLVDGRIGVYTLDDRLDFSLWAKNLTNTYYWQSVNGVSETIYRVAGLPRTFGASVTVRFGPR